MSIPSDGKFTHSHEWVHVEGDLAIVGITDYAQTLLGELVYVELPDVGDVIDRDEDCAIVESVKAASDVYCPLSGMVVEVNEELMDNPALINQEPYQEGWMFKLRIDKPEEIDDLLDAKAYEKQIAEEAH